MSQRPRKRNRFSQKSPPFLTYLKNILHKYPDGGQILKELIQNADDAGASEVIFVHDERDYEKKSLWSEDLDTFQGPALLAYNNATFSDDDWAGIQSTGNSVKLKDPNTVGRFGLGFNSVYHITDLPEVFSGRHIGMLDPQRTVFDDGGFMWNLQDEEDRKEIESLSDQFLPFMDGLRAIDRGNWDNIRETGYFEGTLFRFPLRSSPSELADNLYSTERVTELFECFSKDASISLLFLRNVTRVSLRIIDHDGAVKHLLTACMDVQGSVVLENINCTSSKILTSMNVKTCTLNSFGRPEEVCKWLVIASTIKDGNFQVLEDLAKKLNHIPKIGLAYCLGDKSVHSCGGRLSCFLPLPDREENRTGLPIIIHASFDLTDDRRSIKWVEVDQQHDDAAQWNHLLVEQILPLVYCQAVQAAVSLVRSLDGSSSLAYGIWPDPNQTVHKERWQRLTENIAKCLLQMEVLYTAADSSMWLKATEAVFLPDMQNNDIQQALEDLLLHVGEPLVKVPGHVLSTLLLASNKLRMVTPLFIRGVLQQNSWNRLLSRQKLLILEYVISDEQYQDLQGLQLLPLSDGNFISFLEAESDEKAFIDSPKYPRLLLPGLIGRFLPSDLRSGVLQHLQKMGESQIFRNLVCLDKKVIEKNLLKALPASWTSGLDEVSWHTDESLQPPREWLHVFWNFLQQDADVLSPFEGYPLVPMSPVDHGAQTFKLVRLRQKSCLLVLNKDGPSLTENMVNILETIGCTVIRQWDSQVWHKNLSDYVLAPTSNNILKACSNIGVATVIRKLTAMTVEQKLMFSDLLSLATSLSIEECKVMSQLPIFTKMRSLQSTGSDLVPASNAQAVDKCTVPAIPSDLVLPETLLSCRSENDRRLLQQIRVPFLSAADVAIRSAVAIKNGQYVHHRSEAEGIMLWILRNGDVLFSQSNELRKICESLPFIPCNGEMVKPSALFDPEIVTFQDLFESCRFPPSSFQESLTLKSLRVLGLKDTIQDISLGDVLQIADELNRNQGIKDLWVLERKARALVKVCNDTQVLARSDIKNMQSLCSMAWVPWLASDAKVTFCKPIDMRNKKHSSLVEFSMPITDEFNEQASTSLALNESPPPKKVIENLTALSLHYQTVDYYSLVMKLHNIYRHLQDKVGEFRNMLDSMRIWNGAGFSAPSEILMSYPEDLDLSSQIKKVSHDFLIYKKLFLQCGVRETMTDGEMTSMLQKIMKDIQVRSSGCGTNVELKLVISVLDWMKRRGLHGADDLPIPVHSGRGVFTLRPLSTVLFCDMPKEHLNDLGHDLDYNIVHEDITLTTAAFLKVPLLSTKILKPEYFEPWGPSEPITLRIKNILREYSEEVDLFKEMIQNADDAGATICKFLVDMRQNLLFRNSLIDPEMASCHGPALWSYNNSKFSNDDFCNITRVGAATKELQVEKIGKFGLGFNTVYRVTDVPSILSGSSILMFDPNANHLTKHIQNEANPGIKLNLQKHPQVLQLFSDQFHPYENVFGCDLKGTLDYNGTLIRLPFRTEEDAKSSKICDQRFGEQEIKVLVNIFQESSQNLIIFLKGVQDISLGFLPPELLSPHDTILQLELCREQAQKLSITDDFLLQNEQKAISAVLPKNNVVDVTESTIISVTTMQKSRTYEKHYLLHSSFGIGESLKTFQQNRQNKIRFSLPVAGLALPLKRNIDTGKWTPDLDDFIGQVFCFLPLSIFSGLPFHLNGAFAVMSNRKSLWDTTEKGEWNRKLLCDAVLVAWARALAQLQNMCQNGLLEGYNYYTFWPDIRKIKSLIVAAVEAFYRAVAQGLDCGFLAVFNNGNEWCTIEHACFLSSEIVENRYIGATATQVFSEMLPKPFVAISLPEWVKYGFIASGCGEALLRNTYNWERFYREIIFNNLGDVALEARDALITHAIDMNNKELDRLLMSVPCIPSIPYGTLQIIGNLVHPEGKVASLFGKEDGRFPQGTPETYLKLERLSRLELLGMLKDRLPMMQLMERARNLSAVWKHDRQKACRHVHHILELLRDLVAQTSSNTDHVLFKNIAFLPAILPPCSNMQNVADIVLKKPMEIFHYKHFSLVNLSEPVLSKKHVGKDFKFCKEIMEFLGLNSLPSIQTVMLQLAKVPRMSNELSKQELSEIARKCYTYLNKAIRDEPGIMNEIKTRAFDFPFVLIDHQFVHLSSVAGSISFEAAPYLYQLPKEYHKFDLLWKCLGVRDSFTVEDYIAVLQSIAREHQGNPLPKKEFHLTMKLINVIFERTRDETAVSCDHQTQYMLLPDQDGILRPADRLHYNDTPWLPCEKDMLFCHELIPRSVALRFKVLTKIHKTLQNLKISELSRWVSDFGAKEDLTRRIRNIISEYSSRTDILKELIQNADDSGATEIHFVWDRRTHPTLRTFGEEWNPLQGPALCIYNNKVFTNEDIEGIQQLGKGGKGDRLDKTGKYGLGFNAVYHLTDCPSFVTGDSTLCIFDPNLLFLNTSHHSSPGAKMTVNSEFKNTFQDVYDTFLPAKFNLEQGTLFRLPLRTAEIVHKSEISDQTVSTRDIEALWGELKKNASNFILFLNNIQSIKFSKITQEDDRLKNIISLDAKLSSINEQHHMDFQKKFNELAEAEFTMPETSAHQVFYTVDIHCSWSQLAAKWVVAKQIGVNDDDKLADIRRVCESLKSYRIAHGAVAACINDLVPGRTFCTLPLPVETGLPVHINGSFILDSARRDICGEDGGSAKTEWNFLILTHLLAPLYCDLLEHLCKSSFFKNTAGHLRFKNFQECESSLNAKLLRFFPRMSEKTPPLLQNMVHRVYCTIFEKQSTLIPVYKKEIKQTHTFTEYIVIVEWAGVNQVITEEPHFILGKLDAELEYALQNIHMKVVLPFESLQSIFEEFKKAQVLVIDLHPETVCNYLKVQSLYPEGQSLPHPVSDTLLQSESCCRSLLNFCLKVEKKKIGDCLNDLPLLVTLDGKLRRFCEAEPKYLTLFSFLFPAQKHNFVSHDAVDVENALSLLEAGFLKDFTIQESTCFIKDYLGLSFKVSAKNDIAHHELPESDVAWMKDAWTFFETTIYKNSENIESTKLMFQELVALLSDWAIVPVSFEYENGIFLLPLGNLKIIFYELLDDDLAKGLSKLGFPKLRTSIIPFKIRYHSIKPYLLQTNDCFSVLEMLWARNNCLHWNKLTSWEIKTLLKFLVGGLPKIKNKYCFFDRLQYLPLFKTIDGKHRSLNVYQKRYILDTKLSKEQNDVYRGLYQIDSQTVFLHNCYRHTVLAEDMNIQTFDDLQFLIFFLLPLLPNMCEEHLLKIPNLLLNLKHQYPEAFEDKEQNIFSSLRSVKFIRDGQGTLQQASFYYDPDCSIFKTFQLQTRFIPEDFFVRVGHTFSSIKEILLGVGMRHEVSDQDFIAFATEVEREAQRGISVKSLEPKIKVLFSHMLQLEVDNLTKDFIKNVSTIKFLSAVNINTDLQKIHPAYANNTHLIPFKDSIVNSYECVEMLVWTSAALLETKYESSKDSRMPRFTESQEKLLKSFGVFFDPPLESVLDNIKNVCQAPFKNFELVQKRHQVLEESYLFLQRHLPFDPTPLTSLPVILLEDSTLVDPSQVLFSLPEHLFFKPYLFNVPSQLGRYRELFESIGVEAEPSVFHYTRVLATIYDETKEKESPHGNQRTTLLKATEKLFLLIKQSSPNDELQSLKSLYLPASDGRLYDSAKLVYNNCNSRRAISSLEGSFKFLVHIETCSLFNDQYEMEKLLQQLPEDIQPKLLSQVTSENLHSWIPCSLGDDCELKEQLHGLFSSSIFQEALVSLLRAQNNGETSAGQAAKECKAVFRKLEIICCEKIQTILFKGLESLPDTSLSKDVFILKKLDRECQVYLVHKKGTSFHETVKIITSLAKEINGLMMNVLSCESTLILVEMLSCKNPQDISNVMKDHSILSRNSASQTSFSMPSPGENIPGEWHDSLEMIIVNKFNVGEFVGYMDPDEEGVYVYAIILEKVDSRISGDTEVEMFRIDLGPDRIMDVSALDLYQFKRCLISKNNCRELLTVENLQDQKENQGRWFEKSLKDIKREIDEKLLEIYKLSKKEKTQSIRRLYLWYHPDKNIGQEQLADEVCKYLQQRIRDLEDDRSYNGLGRGFSSPSRGYSSSSHSRNEYKHPRGFPKFWSRWDGEASQHRQHHENFTRRSNCEYDFWGYHDRQQRKPRLSEVSRWFRQAECDLKAAFHDVDRGSPEWVLYKIHQAIQKALIAVLCKKPGGFDTDAPICDLACKISAFSISLKEVQGMVLELERLGVDNKKTQYPNYHQTPGIPNDIFSTGQEKALELARDILNKINEFIQL
ncbi:sacsin-like isoform X2 [Lissotriton helveticus]